VTFVITNVTNSTGGPANRRAFVGIAAGAVAAVAVPENAHAVVSRALAPSGLAARAAGPVPAGWTALAKDLVGTLFRPGQAAYNTARLVEQHGGRGQTTWYQQTNSTR
jgi:hypothetical protein